MPCCPPASSACYIQNCPEGVHDLRPRGQGALLWAQHLLRGELGCLMGAPETDGALPGGGRPAQALPVRPHALRGRRDAQRSQRLLPLRKELRGGARVPGGRDAAGQGLGPCCVGWCSWQAPLSPPVRRLLSPASAPPPSSKINPLQCNKNNNNKKKNGEGEISSFCLCQRPVYM